jgi:hypothetical protein
MYFRTKRSCGFEYLQVAESRRADGKPRQTVVVTVGRLDALRESGELDRLLRSGARSTESDKLRERETKCLAFLRRKLLEDLRSGRKILRSVTTHDHAASSFQSVKTVTGVTPDRVATDGHDSYPRAIRTTLGKTVRHRTSRYLSNRLEQDHRG